MSLELLNTIGTWLGPIITAVGFVFVWNQLKRERVSLETQTAWQVYGLSLNIQTLFIDNPELRPYFHDEAPMPVAEPERSKVLAMAEIICDHLESLVLSKEAMDIDVMNVWVPYMHGLYRKSPAIRDFLRHENEGYRYAKEFTDIISSAASGANG
ncbi:hypothetical protein MTBLM1_120052 [Rhodospirillaceae bacterium LM-1]|nr:hypothetical protein MTBLM1_120052 [Rhodospirillaceae bacterium LM-1]